MPYNTEFKIPSKFAGQFLIVFNHDDMTVLKHMVDIVKTGVSIVSAGSKSYRCLVPSPDAFIISRDVIARVGGFDEIFKLPHIRLAEFVARVIELGVGESVAVDGIKYDFPPHGIDGELFCYENSSSIPGYISEKIFDAFFAGCIPVYLGAEDVTDYIPENCFIDKRNFDSYEDQHEYMSSIDEAKYLWYQANIKKFLSSDFAHSYDEFALAKIILSTCFNIYSNWT